jgi:hypothetical protein
MLTDFPAVEIEARPQGCQPPKALLFELIQPAKGITASTFHIEVWRTDPSG